MVFLWKITIFPWFQCGFNRFNAAGLPEATSQSYVAHEGALTEDARMSGVAQIAKWIFVNYNHDKNIDTTLITWLVLWNMFYFAIYWE